MRAVAQILMTSFVEGIHLYGRLTWAVLSSPLRATVRVGRDFMTHHA